VIDGTIDYFQNYEGVEEVPYRESEEDSDGEEVIDFDKFHENIQLRQRLNPV
jgi:hypothetical protein